MSRKQYRRECEGHKLITEKQRDGTWCTWIYKKDAVKAHDKRVANLKRHSISLAVLAVQSAVGLEGKTEKEISALL